MALLLTVASTAQVKTEHLVFEDIPLDGNMSTFISSCTDKGFAVKEKSEHTVLLSGSYRGGDCDFLVETLPCEDRVWGLTVYLPPSDNWQALYCCYDSIRQSFREQYGNPVHSVETFWDCGDVSTDDQRLSCVCDGRCSYKTVFEDDLGQIDVVIWYSDVRGPHVLVSYIDKANSALQSK